MKVIFKLSSLLFFTFIFAGSFLQAQVTIIPTGVNNGNTTTLSTSNEYVFGNGSMLFSIDLGADGDLKFFRDGNATTGTEAMRILDGTGRIGIGTSSPQGKLHVEGDLFVDIINMGTNLSTNKLELYRLDNSSYSIGVVSGRMQFNIGNPQARYGFYDQLVNGEEIFTIQGSGSTGLGDISPDYTLDVNGSAGKPGGGDWSNASDSRLKQDIEDYKDGLAQILKIRPVWYRYNGKFGLPTKPRYVGIIAQEMQEVAPYTVTPYIETDDETGETGEYLSYDGSAVTYMLVNAVQEQQTQIETLNKALEVKTQEIEDLNARLARLEALLGNNKNTNATLSSARLEQNQPNPFNSNTVVRYFIPETVRQAEIRIFDISGKLIKTIAIDSRGEGQAALQAQTLSAGTYLYSLVLDGQVLDSKQMVLTPGQ